MLHKDTLGMDTRKRASGAKTYPAANTVGTKTGAGQHLPFLAGQEAKYWRDRTMIENRLGIICGDYCGKCLYQCPDHFYWRTGASREARAGER